MERPKTAAWTRRAVLGLAAAGAAGAVLDVGRRVSALTMGDAEVTVLSDGGLVLPMDFYLPGRDSGEIAALLSPHGLPVDQVRPDCNVTLLVDGDRRVLFDAGAGPLFQQTAGRLPESLGAAGIDPASITDVCFTHAHPDHLWGVLDDFDEPAFPQARYWMCRAEWDFWRAPGTLEAMPEATKGFVVGARNRMAAIEDRVSLFDAGAEVLPGVEAVASVGHTPGHTSFAVHRGDEGVLVVGDAIANVVISFERPDWHMGTDQDPARAATTRRRLLDRLAADRLRLIGFHLPHPGTGMVETAAAGYRFVPAS